ncbi:MAG: glucokinase [Burkholderiales bacterium]
MTVRETVIAADVGGTNTKMALGHYDGARVTLVARRVYPSRDYAAFEFIVDAFMSDPEVAVLSGELKGACFAVAGPVEGRRAQLTNLSWAISEEALAQHLGVGAVRVINDFAAAGLGIAELADSDLLTLQPGVPVACAPRVVVGAGTGLGVALLICLDGDYRVYPSEAGHADFAPADEVQDALVRDLRQRFGHVSYERVVSGQGLPAILDFLKDVQGLAPADALVEAMVEGDPARAITRFALSHREPAAVRALDIFTYAYGAFAGNIALAALAHGGVYIAGGIAPKIAAKLEDGTFVRAFVAKGRFEGLMRTLPVKVVMNEQVGLYGALTEAGRAARAAA